MLVCPICEAELLPEYRTEGGWNCVCGEFVPEKLAVDTNVRKCGGKRHE